MPFRGNFRNHLTTLTSGRVPAVEDWLKVFPSYSHQVLYLYWSNSGWSKNSLLGQTKKIQEGGLKGPLLGFLEQKSPGKDRVKVSEQNSSQKL